MTGPLHTAAVAVLALLATVAAAAPESDAAERSRIAADRQAVEARFQAQMRTCESRFAVSQCVVQARQEIGRASCRERVCYVV